MADLMKANYTYSQLIKKYNNFLVPTIKIKVKGKDVLASGFIAVDNVAITLSLKQASVVKFNIINAYQIQKRCFHEEIKNTFVLGSVFTVELGYGSSVTTIFKGFVETIQYDLKEIPELTITGADVRRLMMDTVRKNYPYVVQNYFNAFTELMQTYKKICNSFVIDKTQDKLVQVVQNCSDFDFITKNLCEKANREFFVIAGKAYFLEKMKYSTPIISLGIGNGLMSFSRKLKYFHEELKVIGVDTENKKRIEVTKEIKAYDSQDCVLTKAPITTEVSSVINELNEANLKLDFLERQRFEKAQRGSGSCIGLPELIPGRYIKIEKFDKDADDTYYIQQVQHSFSIGEGFSTQFDIGGYKQKKGS